MPELTLVETGKSGRKIGLEFAPGTTDDCKRLIGQLCPSPGALLGAYRTAREQCKTGDIVLILSPDMSADIAGGTRMEYAQHLAKLYGKRASEFKVWHRSAQSVVKLPKDSEAMWVVVNAKAAELPIMCVLYAIPYYAESN